MLDRLYHQRPCWICKALYWCRHREPIVDLAELSTHLVAQHNATSSNATEEREEEKEG